MTIKFALLPLFGAIISFLLYFYSPDNNKNTNQGKNSSYSSNSRTTGSLKNPLRTVQLFHEFLNENPLLQYKGHIQEKFETIHYGLKNEPNYCLEADKLILENRQLLLEKKIIFTELQKDSLSRFLIQQLGKDIAPNLFLDIKKSLSKKRIYSLDRTISLFYTHGSYFHHYHQVGKNFLCLFQAYNHIPGQQQITGKDFVLNQYFRYRNVFSNAPDCLSTITHIPETYRLFNQSECHQFFQTINTPNYKQSVQQDGPYFILQFGRDIHRGQGVNVMFPNIQQDLVKQYQNGTQCGKLKKVYMVHQYISNPLLYKGNQLEFRIYFLIASTNPLIVYSQNKALVKRCGLKFDKYSKDKAIHLCNTAILNQLKTEKQEKIDTENEQNDRDEEAQVTKDSDSAKEQPTQEQEQYIDWHLEELSELLYQDGLINDTNWLNATLYPQIYKTIIHLVSSGYQNLYRDSRFFQLYAIDFLLDDNMNLWFLENNFNAQILNSTKKRQQRHTKMFSDIFEIQYSYLRSRFLRIQKLAEVIDDMNSISYKEKQELKEQFLNANKNFLQPEYQISSDNTFYQIIDRNFHGQESFMGFLPKSCYISNENLYEDI